MRLFLSFTFLLFINICNAQEQVVSLYEDPIPNTKPNNVKEKEGTWGKGHSYLENITQPSLTAFLPNPGQATGTAVIICPGGGYRVVAMGHEGYEVAEAFQKMGVAAFVLKYRLPSNETMQDKSIGPLQDAQRAIQLIKSKAKQWNIDTTKVGIAGFSAGGHLASSVGTHFQHDYIENKQNISFRPAFMVLGYPVISFKDSLTHVGSRNNLIGENPSEEKIKEYSNELQVTDKTPPTFIFQAENDGTVKVENSLIFYAALHKHGVPAELLLYPKGGHGFGLYNTTTPSRWIEECQKWMWANGWLTKK